MKNKLVEREKEISDPKVKIKEKEVKKKSFSSVSFQKKMYLKIFVIKKPYSSP